MILFFMMITHVQETFIIITRSIFICLVWDNQISKSRLLNILSLKHQDDDGDDWGKRDDVNTKQYDGSN